MTQEELATLKAEIKAELLKELCSTRGPRSEQPWYKVKEHIISRLNKYSTYHQAQIIAAISTIIRFALRLNTVTVLLPSQMEHAKAIADRILDILDVYAQPTGTDGPNMPV